MYLNLQVARSVHARLKQNFDPKMAPVNSLWPRKKCELPLCFSHQDTQVRLKCLLRSSVSLPDRSSKANKNLNKGSSTTLRCTLLSTVECRIFVG